MEIDRKMVRYLLEIKRSLPRAKQHEFNLSSPNINKIVLDVHRTTTDGKIKALAAAFLEQVGRSQKNERKQRVNRASGQIAKPDKIVNPQQQLSNAEVTKFTDRTNGSSSASPKPVVVSDSKNISEQGDLLKVGILPAFLENIDVSELPPLAALSSNKQGRPAIANTTLETSRPAAKSVGQGTVFLDKVAIFLTTPIELSMPIKFVKRRPDA